MRRETGRPERSVRSDSFTVQSAAYSIPQAGAMVGLSRNGSYDAARRGEIPVLSFGKKKVVPKALWDRKLGLTEPARS